MCGMILAPAHYSDLEIEKALEAMGYRGLSGYQGIARKGDYVLGHVRLPIQSDDTTGAQPFVTSRGDLIGFTGEIFSEHGVNLWDEDISEASVLESTLRSPYLQGFMNLDGFWAVIEVQEDKARVLTDHLGIKPLYYWADEGIVCSELTPMFSLVPPPPLDEIYLSNCIKFGYDYSGRTPYQGIVQIAPGTMLTIGELDGFWGSSPFFRYWDWDKVYRPDGLLQDLITQSILTRAGSSRHPVALLLSGGLDSSIIHHVLEKNKRDVEILSIENGESEYLPLGTTILPAVDDPDYEEAVRYMQAPLDLGSLFPQVRLAKALAEKDVNVCLTGDGADELFGGYSRARVYDSQASDVFCELPYYHLPRLDRVLMRHTIELRSPYLAPAVVAQALKVPRWWRTEKQCLKLSFPRLPTKILNRDKHPLKSAEVLADPIAHRIKLVEAFRCLN